MKLPIVIALNGPPGIGKTWLGDKLVPLLLQAKHGIVLARFGLRDLIWAEVAPMFNWNLDGYNDFKRHIFHDNVSGRDTLIQHAESKRAVDTHYWDRKYTESELYRNSDVVVNDSLRKPEEHDWLTRNSSHLITIVMAPTHCSIGQMFDGDSGICLHPRGGFRCHDSNTALSAFTARMKNDPSFLTERL